MMPKHYMTQFHADYVPLADLEPLIKEASLPAGEWWTLFGSKRANNWDVCKRKGGRLSRPQPVEHQPLWHHGHGVRAQPVLFQGRRRGPAASLHRRHLLRRRRRRGNGAAQGHRRRSRLSCARTPRSTTWPCTRRTPTRPTIRVQLLDMHVSPTDVRLNQTYRRPVVARGGAGRALPQGPVARHRPARRSSTPSTLALPRCPRRCPATTTPTWRTRCWTRWA